MSSDVFIALAILGVIASAKGIPILLASIALLGIFYGITWPMYGACGGDYFRKKVVTHSSARHFTPYSPGGGQQRLHEIQEALS